MNKNPFIFNNSMIPLASINKIEILINNQYKRIGDIFNNEQLKQKLYEYDRRDILYYSEILFDLLEGLLFINSKIRRLDWSQEHWDYWKSINKVIFCGGICKSKFGIEVIQQLISQWNHNVEISIADYPESLAIIGGAKYLSRLYDKGYVFDFGHTNIKRGYLCKENNNYEIYLLDNIKSLHTNWEIENIDEAENLNNYIVETICKTIKECGEYEYINIFISMANYVNEGIICPRGGYGKLSLLSDNYKKFLTESIENKLNKRANIKIMHDASSSSLSLDSDSNFETALISFGTSVGIAFKSTISCPNNNYIIKKK